MQAFYISLIVGLEYINCNYYDKKKIKETVHEKIIEIDNISEKYKRFLFLDQSDCLGILIYTKVKPKYNVRIFVICKHQTKVGSND